MGKRGRVKMDEFDFGSVLHPRMNQRNFGRIKSIMDLITGQIR